MEPSTRRYAAPLDGNQQLWKASGLPLTVIGYWHYGRRPGEGFPKPQWPIVADFVDESWDESERDYVASYLGQGLRWRAFGGISECRFCGNPNGYAERTDGAYLWPDGLAHYVRDHCVRLPASVIRHILTRPADLAPQETDGWWQLLNDRDGDAAPGHIRSASSGWLKARINEDWWKTATLDS